MPGPRLLRKRTLLGMLRAAHVRPLPGGCMAKGRSHPHLYPVLPQIPLQIVDFHLLCVEDRRGQTGIYCRVIAEQLKEILLFACAAGGDDGHGAACGHGVQQLQIKAGAPVLRITRTAYDGAGVPFEYTESVYRGDKYVFNVTLEK